MEHVLSILSESSVPNFKARMVNNGLDDQVVEAGLRRCLSEQQWLKVWAAVGESYRRHGDEFAADGALFSAAELYLKAAIAFHYAQFLHFSDVAAKMQMIERKNEIFRAAAANLRYPVTIMDADFEGVTLPVHVRMPASPGPHPAVIVVSGMDSSKEEFFGSQTYLLDRGLATIGFDGPGQNEVWPKMKMRPDFHKAISAVADALEPVPGLDTSRLGLMGQSFGAFLGPSVLARDPRFKAGVFNGGFFDLSYFDWANPIREIGLPFLFGLETAAEAKEAAKRYSLQDYIADVKQPILVIHGSRDKDAPPEAARKIVDLSGGGGRFVEFAEGIHMCHNVAHLVRPLTADWFCRHLGLPLAAAAN